MLDARLMAQVRLLRLRSRRAVTEVFAGEYTSAFKGRGMEFSEVRAYEPGDDIRAIDWNVTARAGTPFVKRFVEERELTLVVVMDVSASTAFGTAGRAKRETGAELAAVLTTAALRSNDKVGLISFDSAVRAFVPARKGQRHGLRVLRELLRDPRGEASARRAERLRRLFGRALGPAPTDPRPALDAVMRHFKRRAVVLMVSDFLFDRSRLAETERMLKTVRRRHDVILARVGDPRERSLPRAGLIELADPETGRRVTVDSSSRGVRERFAQRAASHAAQVRGVAKRGRCDLIELETGRAYLRDLMELFRARERRAAR
jgi:uncharacterized protein (DUF58 family)